MLGELNRRRLLRDFAFEQRFGLLQGYVIKAQEITRSFRKKKQTLLSVAVGTIKSAIMEVAFCVAKQRIKRKETS